MAERAFNSYPAAGSIDGTEKLLIAQGATTLNTTPNQILQSGLDPTFGVVTADNLIFAASQSVSNVLASPTNAPGIPTWRQLTTADIGGVGTLLSSPPPIGNITPNTGAFTSVEFNGGGSSRLLSYVSADTALEYSVGGTPRFRVNDGGGIASNLAFGNQGSALALTYPGGTTAVFTPKIAFSGALSGQIVGGPAAVGVTSWTINSDSLDTTTGAGAPRGINDFYIGHTISAGATGGRNGVNVFLNQTGATTLAAGQFYVGVASNVVASFNAGGVSGTPAGAVMGFNPRAVLQSGATWFNSAVGMEVDFGARAGSSVSYKYGLTVVLDQLDAVDASVNSAGLVFGLNASAGPTSPGLMFGVQYGGPQNWWPINPTLGTLIGVAPPINGSGPAYTALYGVDVSAVTFSGAAFKSTGFSVDGTGLIAGSAKATGGTTARTLAAIFADQNNVKSFGAVGNGTTVDLTALTTAPVPAYMPNGVFYTGASIGALAAGRYTGAFGGGILQTLESGVSRQGARDFSVIVSAPARNPGYSEGGQGTAFDADFSRVHIVAGARVSGTATLGQPTTGYLLNQPASMAYFNLVNLSGWNQSTSGNDGRTGLAAQYLRFAQSGQGDVAAIFVNGSVSGVKAGATSFLANSAGAMLSGQIFAVANGVYLQGIGDIDLNDGGFDVAGIGTVLNFSRTVGAGALGATWMGVRLQTSGTVAIDSFYSASGLSRMGIDFSYATFQDLAAIPTYAAMALTAGMRIYGDATNPGTSTHYSNNTVLGTEWLSYETATGWGFVVGSAPVLQASATAVTASANLIRKGATADQSADVFVATAAGSHTIPNGCSWECLTPAGTIATFATTMPAAPIDKQEVWISTTNTITTWTLNANSGQTINSAPTTLAANTSVMFRYNLATTAWFRMI